MNKIFSIKDNKNIRDVIKALNKYAVKSLAVVNQENKLTGVISDGDIRKMLLKNVNLDIEVKKICNQNPTYLKNKKYSNQTIEKLFKDNKFDIIPIVDKKNKLINVIHWSDVINNYKKKYSYPVIIMSGGKGTRMKPFSNVLPKLLIPVNNKTLIENIIQRFNKDGFNYFIFTLNYKKNILDSFLKGLNNKLIIETVHEKKPLGTAGSLSFLKNHNFKNFIIINCDMYININFKNPLKFHQDKKFDITIITSSHSFKFPYGVIKSDKNLNFTKFEEKPLIKKSINLGAYIVSKKLINLVKKNSYQDMDKLIILAKRKKLKVGVYSISEAQWIDFGDWEKYSKNKLKLNKI